MTQANNYISLGERGLWEQNFQVSVELNIGEYKTISMMITANDNHAFMQLLLFVLKHKIGIFFNVIFIT